MICIIMLLEKKGRKSVGHAYVPACNSKTNKHVFLLKKIFIEFVVANGTIDQCPDARSPNIRNHRYHIC